MIIQANICSLFSMYSVVWKLEARGFILEDNLELKEGTSSVPQENMWDENYLRFHIFCPFFNMEEVEFRYFVETRAYQYLYQLLSKFLIYTLIEPKNINIAAIIVLRNEVKVDCFKVWRYQHCTKDSVRKLLSIFLLLRGKPLYFLITSCHLI